VSSDEGGVFRSGPKISPEEQTRDFARAQVRAGLLDEAGVLSEVTEAVEAELRVDDPQTVAAELVATARAELADDERTWPDPTDYERLQTAFAELAASDVVVLQGIADHWTANAELRRRAAEGRPPRGVAWFTAPDVWHAVDHGMLEVNVWHADSANVAPGDGLLDLVVDTLGRHGLPAHFDEGRVEVTASWHRRLTSSAGPAAEGTLAR